MASQPKAARRPPAARTGAPRRAAKPPRKVSQAKPRGTVVLVHGILGQRALYWNLLERRLEKDGFRTHVVGLPYYLLGDLRRAARFLRDEVERACRADEVERVDVVAHSAGGLACRYYVARLGGAKRVSHLVCLGTPHHGTYFAYLLALPGLAVARQTRPGDPFLASVNRRKHGVRVTNLWSRVDGIVMPPRNAILEGAHNLEVPWIGHWAFLWSTKVHDLVAKVLASPAHPAPVPVQPLASRPVARKPRERSVVSRRQNAEVPGKSRKRG